MGSLISLLKTIDQIIIVPLNYRQHIYLYQELIPQKSVYSNMSLRILISHHGSHRPKHFHMLYVVAEPGIL